MFLEFSQNSQENTCIRISFLIKWQAIGDISKNTFFTEYLRWLLLDAFRRGSHHSINKKVSKIEIVHTTQLKFIIVIVKSKTEIVQSATKIGW